MNGNNVRGKSKLLDIGAVAFLVISLVAVAYSTNSQVQLIASEAKTRVQKTWQDIGNPKARQAARQAAEEAAAAKLAAQQASATLGTAQAIVDQINSSTDQLQIEKYFSRLQTYVSQGTITQDQYNKIVDTTDARLLISDVAKATTPSERAPLLEQLNNYRSEGIITDSQYQAAAVSGTIQAIVDEINKSSDQLQIEKYFNQLQTYVSQGIISQSQYNQIIDSTDARLLIADIQNPNTTAQQKTALLPQLKTYADRGIISQDTYNKIVNAVLQAEQPTNTSQLSPAQIVQVTGAGTQPALGTPPTTGTALKPIAAGCSTDSECGSGFCQTISAGRGGRTICAANPGVAAVESGQTIPNYAACQSDRADVTAGCNYRYYQNQISLNALTFGNFNPYLQIQQQLNAQYGSALTAERIFNTQNLGAALNLYTAGGFNQYVAAQQQLNARYGSAATLQRIANTENLAASSKLGGQLVAQSALIVAGGGAGAEILSGGSFLTAAGGFLTDTLAIQAQSSTTNAITSCALDVGGSQCKTDVIIAALSWFNVKTIDVVRNLLAKGTPAAIEAARVANIAVTIPNVALSGSQTYKACSSGNTAGCLIGGSLTVFMGAAGGIQAVNLFNDLRIMRASATQVNLNTPQLLSRNSTMVDLAANEKGVFTVAKDVGTSAELSPAAQVLKNVQPVILQETAAADTGLIFAPQLNEISSTQLTGELLLANAKVASQALVQTGIIQAGDVFGQLLATKNYLARGSISDVFNPSEVPQAITDFLSTDINYLATKEVAAPLTNATIPIQDILLADNQLATDLASVHAVPGVSQPIAQAPAPAAPVAVPPAVQAPQAELPSAVQPPAVQPPAPVPATTALAQAIGKEVGSLTVNVWTTYIHDNAGWLPQLRIRPIPPGPQAAPETVVVRTATGGEKAAITNSFESDSFKSKLQNTVNTITTRNSEGKYPINPTQMGPLLTTGQVIKTKGPFQMISEFPTDKSPPDPGKINTFISKIINTLASNVPENVVEIDNQKWLLFEGRAAGVMPNEPVMFAYNQSNSGDYQLRVFWKSQSGGDWRSTRMIEGGYINKGIGISYTQETQLDPRLESALIKNLQTEKSYDWANDKSIKLLFNNLVLPKQLGWYSYNPSVYSTTDTAAKNVLAAINKYQAGNLGIKYGNSSITGKDFSSLNIPDSFIPDFKQPPVFSYDDTTALLGKVHYEVYEHEWNGRTLNWIMGTDSEGRIWIKNIYLKDSELTSYGTYSEIFPGGILVSKPLDYGNQTDAINLGFTLDKKANYTDITPLLDYLKPIADYRAAKGIVRTGSAVLPPEAPQPPVPPTATAEILGPSEVPVTTGPSLTAQVAADQASLLADTGLPNPGLINQNPAEFQAELQKVADANGLSVTIPPNSTSIDLVSAAADTETQMIMKYEAFTPEDVAEYKDALASTDLSKLPEGTLPQAPDDPIAALRDEFSFNEPTNQELVTLRQQVANLQDKLSKDPATGLLNKPGGDEALSTIIDAAKRSGGPVSVIGIDISGLKQVNDTFGHAAGDILIQEAASIFETTARRSSDIIIRQGIETPGQISVVHSHGDEFGLVLPGTDENGAKILIQRMQTELKARQAAAPADDIVQKLGFDSGVAQWNGSETPGELLGRADDSMYAAKSARKAGLSPATNPPTTQPLTILSASEKAMQLIGNAASAIAIGIGNATSSIVNGIIYLVNTGKLPKITIPVPARAPAEGPIPTTSISREAVVNGLTNFGKGVENFALGVGNFFFIRPRLLAITSTFAVITTIANVVSPLTASINPAIIAQLNRPAIVQVVPASLPAQNPAFPAPAEVPPASTALDPIGAPYFQDTPSRGAYTGADQENLYQRMLKIGKDNPKVFWMVQTNGNFTRADMLSMILMGEATAANGTDPQLLQAMMDAVKNQLWSYNNPYVLDFTYGKYTGYCYTTTCQNDGGALEWLARVSESAQKRFRASDSDLLGYGLKDPIPDRYAAVTDANGNHPYTIPAISKYIMGDPKPIAWDGNLPSDIAFGGYNNNRANSNDSRLAIKSPYDDRTVYYHNGADVVATENQKIYNSNHNLQGRDLAQINFGHDPSTETFDPTQGVQPGPPLVPDGQGAAPQSQLVPGGSLPITPANQPQYLSQDSSGAVFFTNDYKPLPKKNFLDEYIKPQGIVLHWDENPYDPVTQPDLFTTKLTYRALIERKTSVHFAVGPEGVVQFMPMKPDSITQAYGNSGLGPDINIEFVGINFNKKLPPQSEIDNAVDLISRLVIQYKLDINSITHHVGQADVNPEFVELIKGLVKARVAQMGYQSASLSPSGFLGFLPASAVNAVGAPIAAIWTGIPGLATQISIWLQPGSIRYAVDSVRNSLINLFTPPTTVTPQPITEAPAMSSDKIVAFGRQVGNQAKSFSLAFISLIFKIFLLIGAFFITAFTTRDVSIPVVSPSPAAVQYVGSHQIPSIQDVTWELNLSGVYTTLRANDPAPDGLTSKGTGLCGPPIGRCDGARMWDLYQWYKGQTGAWWYHDGNFTSKDFLALMLLGEVKGSAKNDPSGDVKFYAALTSVIKNQLWGSAPGHDAYCKTTDCTAGIMNFLGDYVESAWYRYDGLQQNGGNPSPETLMNLGSEQDKILADKLAANDLTFTDFSNAIFSDPSSADFGNDAPTQWGCLSCGDPNLKWVGTALDNNAKIGTLDKCGIAGAYGQDVIYTLNQEYTWSKNKVACTGK